MTMSVRYSESAMLGMVTLCHLPSHDTHLFNVSGSITLRLSFLVISLLTLVSRAHSCNPRIPQAQTDVRHHNQGVRSVSQIILEAAQLYFSPVPVRLTPCSSMKKVPDFSPLHSIGRHRAGRGSDWLIGSCTPLSLVDV